MKPVKKEELEGHIIPIPERLYSKIIKIQEDMQQALKQTELPYIAAINNLVDGFLSDKEAPESGKLKIDYKTRSLVWEEDMNSSNPNNIE